MTREGAAALNQRQSATRQFREAVERVGVTFGSLALPAELPTDMAELLQRLGGSTDMGGKQ